MSEQPVKPGAETTEYAMAKGANLWGNALMVLGVVASAIELAAPHFTPDSTVGVWLGAASTISGALIKALASLGYSVSRGKAKGAK